MKMTPNHIDVLIHCYIFYDQHSRIHTPAVQQAIRDLIREGLLEHVNTKDIYQTTDRGAAHVRQICGLALPVSKEAWVRCRRCYEQRAQNHGRVASQA